MTVFLFFTVSPKGSISKGIRVFFLAQIFDNLKNVRRMETSNMDQDKIKLFEDRPIRTAWDEKLRTVIRHPIRRR